MEREANRLVNEYSDLILRLSYTYLNSTHDAEDICQDVLIKLITSQVNFKSREHEKAWVIRVAINACKDIRKHSSRHPTLEDHEADSCSSHDEIRQIDHAARSSVTKAVGHLPENQREAIYLHYYEGYKIEEIARLTQSSPAAVAKRLSRARETLRIALGGSRYE